jgi:chromosome partitioning protein
MRTIAIVNGKGGTGKTTTAVHLAAALGEAGKEVLLVDLDGQATASRWLGVPDDPRFADALSRGTGLEPLKNVMPHVALAPGHGKLDAIALDLHPSQAGQLRKVLAEQRGFDFILIDCPPSLGNRLVGSALLAAQEAIVPVEPSPWALNSLALLQAVMEEIRKGPGHRIEITGVLACRCDGQARLGRSALEELRRALGSKVFQTVIREDDRLHESCSSGKSPLAFAPDSHAARDYRALAKELMMTHSAAALPQHSYGDAAKAQPAAPMLAAIQPPPAQAPDALAVVAAPAATHTPAAQAAPQADAPAPPAGEESPNVDEVVWKINGSGGEEPADRRKAAPAGAPPQNYPALQEALTQLGDVPPAPVTVPDSRPPKRPAWRRILDKIVAGRLTYR